MRSRDWSSDVCSSDLASGAGVTAWDEREEARDDAMALGADIGNPLEIDLVGFAGVVVSPGVPLNRHPIAAHAREAHAPVIGDLEQIGRATRRERVCQYVCI